MGVSLTEKQQLVYDFLKKQIKTKGYPPTVREICEAVNLSSTSTVHSHLESLEKKGYIRKSPSKNRSIEILEENFYDKPGDIVYVPIVGNVAAGAPILATENIEGTFPIPVDYINNNDVFMLRIKGDSMTDAGIFHRDLVLVAQQPWADNGDIVVALIDDSATVKTFYQEEDHVRLQAENPAYQPILTKEVRILGKVIGLYRKL